MQRRESRSSQECVRQPRPALPLCLPPLSALLTDSLRSHRLVQQPSYARAEAAARQASDPRVARIRRRSQRIRPARRGWSRRGRDGCVSVPRQGGRAGAGCAAGEGEGGVCRGAAAGKEWVWRGRFAGTTGQGRVVGAVACAAFGFFVHRSVDLVSQQRVSELSVRPPPAPPLAAPLSRLALPPLLSRAHVHSLHSLNSSNHPTSSMPSYIDVPSFPLSHGGKAIPAVGLGASQVSQTSAHRSLHSLTLCPMSHRYLAVEPGRGQQRRQDRSPERVPAH